MNLYIYIHDGFEMIRIVTRPCRFRRHSVSINKTQGKMLKPIIFKLFPWLAVLEGITFGSISHGSEATVWYICESIQYKYIMHHITSPTSLTS